MCEWCLNKIKVSSIYRSEFWWTLFKPSEYMVTKALAYEGPSEEPIAVRLVGYRDHYHTRNRVMNSNIEKFLEAVFC